MTSVICQLCIYGEKQRVRYKVTNNLIPSWINYFCYNHGEEVDKVLKCLGLTVDWKVELLTYQESRHD